MSKESIKAAIENADRALQKDKGPTLIKVQYCSADGKVTALREYTYYSEDRLADGDIITVPVRDTTGTARVSAIDVPDSSIASFRDKVKTIPSGSKLPTIRPEQEEMEEGLQSEGLTLFGLTHATTIPNVEAAPSTASPDEMSTELTLRPGEDIEVHRHYEKSVKLLEYAEARVIATDEDNKLATDDAKIISKLLKLMEAKKKEYLAPLKTQMDTIRETYTCLMGPILEADKITRDKMTVFMVEQEKKKKAAEELDRQAIELARKQAEMNDGEFTVDLKPVESNAAPRLTRTESATSGLVAHWTYEVIDIDSIPREYMIPDDAMLKAIAKSSHDKKPVPGIRFYNEPVIAVRGK